MHGYISTEVNVPELDLVSSLNLIVVLKRMEAAQTILRRSW